MYRVLAIAAVLVVVASARVVRASDAAQEFLNGQRLTFSTKDHPKAKGVHLTIAYPSSWRAAEGERPHIVQKFVNDESSELEMVAILIKDLPLPPGTVLTEEDQREVLADIQSGVPPGATLIRTKATRIEALPAGIYEVKMQIERGEAAAVMHLRTLSFFWNNKLIQVQCGVGGPVGTDDDVAQRMAALTPLFMLIENSVVLPDRWTSSTTPFESNQQYEPAPWFDEQSDSIFWLSIAIGLVVTWGVALAPPIVIRYVIVRRPLPRKTAGWIAAGFSFVFWFAFLALAHAMGERRSGTTGSALWIIMFFVARWIMSRGYVVLTQERKNAQAISDSTETMEKTPSA